MYERTNASFKMIHYGNRELVVKSGPVKPILDFSQYILGLTGPDLITSKTT